MRAYDVRMRLFPLLAVGLILLSGCGGETPAPSPAGIVFPSEPAEWHPAILTTMPNPEKMRERYRDTLTSGLEDEE